MISIFEMFTDSNSTEDSAIYRWLEIANKNTMKSLGKTIDPARFELISFLSEQETSILNIEKVADLIIKIWVRGLQILDMLKSIDYDKERDLLRNDIENGKKWIKSLERLSSSSHVGMKTIFHCDLKLAPDVDREIQIIQKRIDYFESILNQNFDRKSALDYSQVKKLLMFTLFYIGEEILGMEQAKKPKPLYRFVKILIEINTGEPFDESRIGQDYKKYLNAIKNCSEISIQGEKHGVQYSFTPYQDGWKYVGISQVEMIERFIEIEVNFYEVNLLKFIYTMKIPDHILTMFIFDYKLLSEIISLLDNK